MWGTPQHTSGLCEIRMCGATDWSYISCTIHRFGRRSPPSCRQHAAADRGHSVLLSLMLRQRSHLGSTSPFSNRINDRARRCNPGTRALDFDAGICLHFIYVCQNSRSALLADVGVTKCQRSGPLSCPRSLLLPHFWSSDALPGSSQHLTEAQRGPSCDCLSDFCVLSAGCRRACCCSTSWAFKAELLANLGTARSMFVTRVVSFLSISLLQTDHREPRPL